MTKLMRYFCAPAIAVLTLFSGSLAATASSADDPPPAAPWPPEDTHGEFLPVPDAFYAPYDIQACGTTINLRAGDVRKTTYKSVHFPDGSVKIVYRGDATLDVTRSSDGAAVDELDVSGRYSERHGPDGLTHKVTAWGPSMIWAVNEVEVKELASEGLPSFLYFTNGKISGESRFADETQASVVSLDITHNSVKGAQDVCKMLDRAIVEHCSLDTDSKGLGCPLPPRPAPEDSAKAAVEANTAVAFACPPEANCQYQPTMYDIDGDGLYDPYVADLNGNGFLDQNLVAANGVLIWLFDTNENSVPDQYGGDTNADAVPDFWLLDVNEDRVLDQIVTDPAVHSTTPAVSSTGGTDLIIDHGRIPLSPAGLTAAVDGLLIPGARTPTDYCAFLSSAALLGTDYSC